ncbi:hypothetical protein LB518_05160 [Mesorhizobium sp. BR1-1-16]|uniref:hypothetical protein n=1 Tax=Mesorhizobium sp. BR1-1-16 TaxID=2876653 RepID=UPI001CCAA979|nr:hypothetical protein [Mesorhizobium sp. BR1-1-16]MBZ9935669.1 hypothetical protein [Mesorhizobium sp. BR1-1-16]
MTSLTAERLYTLLPAIYRIRDEAEGGPLRALIGAMAEQFAALEENVEQLYDDQFIETCADWVAPYIGALIGYRPLHGVAPNVASPRAEVANTIAYRRRKGTALMLEQLAGDVTGWPARAVEFFELLATTQYMKHPRLHARASADLRDTAATFRVGGAFDSFAHTAEMRAPEGGSGRYNIPNIGIFLWRLVPLRLSGIPLTPDPADASGRRFRFNPLGADMKLFRHGLTEDDIGHLAEPINVPEPLTVRLAALGVKAAQAGTIIPPDEAGDDDYGAGESFVLSRVGQPGAVSVNDIRICDLRDVFDGGGVFAGWNHEAAVLPGSIGVDPERGRVLLGEPADGPLLATFHYGSTRPFGGGEYERDPAGADLPLQRTVNGGAALQPELDAITGGGRLLIEDSLTYSGTPVFGVDGESDEALPSHEVVIAAKDGARPLIASGSEITLDIGARGRLVLDGLVISGGALRLPALAGSEPVELVLRDCTLVPGLRLETDGSALSPGAPSLVVEHPFANVTLVRCITGPIRIDDDAEISLEDCIVDAGSAEAIAFAGLADDEPGGTLTAKECTIVGKVRARRIELASNSIFFSRLGEPPGGTWAAPVLADRRQEGCMRFSYVPTGSITPRRYRCVPDEAHPGVLPHFTSLRYGEPAYGQLRRVTDPSIRSGAENDSEMGVLHALFQPQRETNLRIRLEEYLRFGLRAGFFYAS